MSCKIIPTETFKTQVRTLQKKYPHIRQDLKDLSKRLKHNPKSGKALGKGVYKIRLGSSDLTKGSGAVIESSAMSQMKSKRYVY
jgi:hypothetical protein